MADIDTYVEDRLNPEGPINPDPGILLDAAWRLSDRLGLTCGAVGTVAFNSHRFFIYLRGPWLGATPSEFEGIPITWGQPCTGA